MATTIAPPRTPSPKVRIRAQSFDSPSSRISVTPVEESPFSKSTGAIVGTTVSHNNARDISLDALKPASVLFPLNTKMSDESMSSESSSESSSPSDSEALTCDSPSVPERARPHPLAFCQSITYDEDVEAVEQSASPFEYQDKSCPMYSPWLVRAVLDLHDVRGLDWMSIAGPVERIWGVETSSAEVLGILSDNGRVLGRRWWD